MQNFAKSAEEKLASSRLDAENSVAALQVKVSTWAANFQESMKTALQQGDIGALSGAREKKGPKMDKKEVAVWKLPDGISRPDVRHWLGAVDVQLESSHDFQLLDVVLDKVRRLKTEVKEEDLRKVINDVNEERSEEYHRRKKRQGLQARYGGVEPLGLQREGEVYALVSRQ